MSSKNPKHKSKNTRHRITEIELIPTTSNRQISTKVLVDNEVVRELPWIKSGRPLRWTKLIVCDGFDNSKVILEIFEKHSIKDRRFRSKAYIFSSVQQQTEVTVEFIGIAWKATFKLLTPAAAEQSFAAGISKLRELKSAPSTLEKLGKARTVFQAMLQFGSEISEIHPTSKMAFAIFTKTWEKLEMQEQCNENVRGLLDGLGGVLEFVELIKDHVRSERLQGTIREFLTFLEDVSVWVSEQAESTNRPARTLRALLESGEHDRVGIFLGRFERLRAELSIGIGAETHQKIHIMNLHSLLSQLQPVTPSGHDPSRACQEGTREAIIANIVSWTKDQGTSERLLWVHGQAGIGKSSIATSVCQQLADEKVLAASFFCKRDDPGRRDPLRLVNSIAHGLAIRHPSYGQAVATAIQEDRELCMAHMDIRYKGLIKQPLQTLQGSTTTRPLIVVVDALDECGSDDARRILLRHLSDMSGLVPWLKMIITSRPDGDIQENFQRLDNTRVSSCNVHNYDASDDIRAYFEKELGEIARRHRWDDGLINQLCEKAGGVFIWAATVKNYLKGFKGSTIPRLQKILNDQKSTVSDNLDTLYTSVIMTAMGDEGEDQRALFRQCIGAVVLASTRQPLSISSLGSLLFGHIDLIALEDIVNSLYAVLHIDEHSGGAVRFYHPSFADYATDPSRSGDLYVVPVERNTELAMGCLDTLKRELRFNICKLETSYMLNSQVLDLAGRIKSKISGQLGYACTYWMSHLIDTSKGKLASEVQVLMNSPRVLYWLEVLSLLGRVEVGLQGLLDLQDWLPESTDVDELLRCFEDMYRFTSAFYDPISASAPHIYVTALALAPSSTRIIRRFRSLFPNTVTVTSGGDTDWPRWLRTLVHPDKVVSLAVSSDGRLLVTGSSDEAVRIWDVRSGAMVGEPLFSDLGFVTSVALSPDGSRIVSGHLHRALQLWDTKAGVSIGEPLDGHFGIITCVAFSPDGSRLASGAADMTIRLWDAKAGVAVGDPLVGHSETVQSITFWLDGTYIISCASDNTVRIWDVKTRVIDCELLIDHGSLSCVAVCPRGHRIVYGSSAGLGTIHWDPNDSIMTNEPIFQDESCRISSLAFSHDGSRVIFGTYDNAVGIWDLEKRGLVGGLLTGHSDVVRSVAFLPDDRRVASGSHDMTVRLWETRPRSDIADIEPAVGHSHHVVSVAFSSDGERIASGSLDKTIRLWSTKTRASVGRPLVHSDSVSSLAFSPHSDYIVSASFDGTLRIWDVESGAAIGEPLVKHSSPARSIAFSPDGTLIASGSRDGALTVISVSDMDTPKITQIWSTETINEVCEQPPKRAGCVHSVAFSPDGEYIASGSSDKIIRLWVAKTGALMGDPLVGHSNMVYSVAFSPDGGYVVSGSEDRTVRLWDSRLGIAACGPFVGHTGGIHSVTFSPDGSRILSCSHDKTVRMWDSKTGARVGEPFVCRANIDSVAFSHNGSCFVSGSWDGSVRVWNTKAVITGESNHPDQSDPQDHTLLQSATMCAPHTYALLPHPEHRGWASLDGRSLLLWLPIQYRREYSPNLLYTLSADPSHSMIRLDFSKFAHGSSWATVACDQVRQNLA